MPFLSNDLLAALPRLRRYARVLTNDPDRADEMVKEMLTRARQIETRSPSGATVVVRLFAMLRSVYLDQFAPGRPRAPLSALDARESSRPPAADSISDPSQSNASLLEKFLQLPLEHREVLVLAAVERMSYDDIAMLLAIPLATVLARLTQARESLRSGVFDAMRSPNNAR